MSQPTPASSSRVVPNPSARSTASKAGTSPDSTPAVRKSTRPSDTGTGLSFPFPFPPDYETPSTPASPPSK